MSFLLLFFKFGVPQKGSQLWTIEVSLKRTTERLKKKKMGHKFSRRKRGSDGETIAVKPIEYRKAPWTAEEINVKRSHLHPSLAPGCLAAIEAKSFRIVREQLREEWLRERSDPRARFVDGSGCERCHRSVEKGLLRQLELEKADKRADPRFTEDQWSSFWEKRRREVGVNRQKLVQEAEESRIAFEADRELLAKGGPPPTPVDTRPAADPVRQARLEEAVRVAGYLACRGYHLAIPSPTFFAWPREGTAVEAT